MVKRTLGCALCVAAGGQVLYCVGGEMETAGSVGRGERSVAPLPRLCTAVSEQLRNQTRSTATQTSDPWLGGELRFEDAFSRQGRVTPGQRAGKRTSEYLTLTRLSNIVLLVVIAPAVRGSSPRQSLGQTSTCHLRPRLYSQLLN